MIFSILPGCHVAKGAVRSEPIVVLPPCLDQHLRLLQVVEDLSIQQFIPKLAVEALDVAVLPGAARLDEQGAHLQPAQPLPHRLRDKLRPVV